MKNEPNAFKTAVIRSCCLIALAFSGATQQAHARNRPNVRPVLEYFANACPYNGPWTQNALNQTKGLIDLLVQAQVSDECKTLSGAITQLGTLQNQIQSLDNARGSSLETATGRAARILELQDTQRTLLDRLIDPSTGAQELTVLNQQLAILAQEILRLENRESDGDAAQRTALGQTLEQLTSGTQSLLQQFQASRACLVRNPGIAAGVASLASSVAARVTTGPASLALAATTDLFGTVMDFAREQRIQRHINDFDDVTLRAQAYSCALQAMSDNWCRVQDELRLTELRASIIESEDNRTQLWRSARYLEVEVPNFLTWLRKIRAGQNPSSPAISDAQNEARNRRVSVDNFRSRGLGYFSDGEKRFKLATNPEEKWNEIRGTLISFLTSQNQYSRESRVPEVFKEIIKEEEAPYFLLGLSLDQIPRPNGVVYNFSDFNPVRTIVVGDNFTWSWPLNNGVYIPDFDILNSRLTEWVDLARAKADRELNLIIQFDIYSVMSESKTDEYGYGEAPIESLAELTRFITHFLGECDEHNALAPLAAETLQILEQVQTILETLNLENASESLDQIFTLLKLENDTTVIENRLNRLINADLQDALERDSTLAPELKGRFLVSRDILREFLSSATRTSSSQTVDDLDKAQGIYENNLLSFVDLFDRDIKNTLEELSQNPDRFGSRLKELCVLLLAAPEWPANIPVSLCLGQKFESVYQDVPDSIEVSWETVNNQDPAIIPQRMCGIRNFYRSEQIYEYHRSVRFRSRD